MCKPGVTGTSCHCQGEGLLGGDTAPRKSRQNALRPVSGSLVPPVDTACRGNKGLKTREVGLGLKAQSLIVGTDWEGAGRGGGAGQSEREVLSLSKPRCHHMSLASL